MGTTDLANRPGALLQVGEWRVDADHHRLLDAEGSGREIRLEPKAMQVLVCLARRRGEVVAKEEIIRGVWGDAFVSDQVLTNAVWELRRALGDDARTQRWIQTVPREGYRMVNQTPVPATVRGSERPGPARSRRLRAWATATAALFLAAVLAWAVLRQPASPPPAVTRFSVHFEEPLASFHLPVAALSKDGSRLVFVSVEDGTSRLYLRRMDRLDLEPITGTEGAHGPFFSPDGEWIGYYAQGELRKVRVEGGPVTRIRRIETPRGATWAEDGRVYFAPASSSAIWRVAASGEGEAEPLTTLVDTEWSHRWPEVLPGAETILFTVADDAVVTGFDEAKIFAASLTTGKRRLLIGGGSFPRYTAGHVVFVRGSDLLAAPLDPDRLELTGPPRRVLAGVRRFPINGAAQFALAPGGTLAYVPGGDAWEPPRRLLRVSREGEETVLEDRERLYYDPAVSPDGRKVAVVIAEAGNSDLWVVDLDRGTQTRLTDTPGEEQGPVWSPDGRRIAYYYSLHGPFQMLWRDADGGGEPTPLAASDYSRRPESFTPDGTTLVFSELHPETGFDLWALSLDSVPERSVPRPLLGTRFDERHARVSPDGRWLAYVSDESGTAQVYLRPLWSSSEPGRTQLSPERGDQPLWDASGERLTYRSPEAVMEVRIPAGSRPGAPRRLFPWRFPLRVFEGLYRRDLDTFPNGDLLMIRSRPAERQQLHVVLGWSGELTSPDLPLR